MSQSRTTAAFRRACLHAAAMHRWFSHPPLIKAVFFCHQKVFDFRTAAFPRQADFSHRNSYMYTCLNCHTCKAWRHKRDTQEANFAIGRLDHLFCASPQIILVWNNSYYRHIEGDYFDREAGYWYNRSPSFHTAPNTDRAKSAQQTFFITQVRSNQSHHGKQQSGLSNPL